MRRTLYNMVRAVRALNATAVSTNANTDGAAVNLDQNGADFRTAILVAMTGAWTDGTYSFVPQESANGSSGWQNVPADRLTGGPATLAVANGIAEIGITPDPGSFPFLRVRVVSTAVTTGANVHALFVLGQPSSEPITR